LAIVNGQQRDPEDLVSAIDGSTANRLFTRPHSGASVGSR
jgi:hypothetical protein